MNKEKLKRFIDRLTVFAKQNEKATTYSIILTQGGLKNTFAVDYDVTEAFRKSFNQIIKGEEFEKLEIVFINENKKTPFSFISENENSVNNTAKNNQFQGIDYNSLGLGLAGITAEIQSQGFGAVMSEAIKKTVAQNLADIDLAEKTALVKEQNETILKLTEEVEELRKENADVLEMKQSFSLKGLNLAEFLGEMAGGLLKKYPNSLAGFGVEKEKIIEFFKEENTKEIEDVKPKNFDDEDSEKKETPADKAKSEIIKKLSAYLGSLPMEDFKITIEIYDELQNLGIEAKKTILDLIKSEK